MTQQAIQKRDAAKVAIIGPGRIGTNVAFQIYNRLGRKGLVEDIMLIGRNSKKVSCVAEEIYDANDGSIPTRLTQSTEPQSAAGYDVVVYAAGRTIRSSEKREDLLVENGILARTILDRLEVRGNEVFITVTNPVDVLNTYFSRELGLPANQVIGFGGMLDAARFRQAVVSQMRNLLGKAVYATEVKNAFVLGQHGDWLTPLFERLELPASVPPLDAGTIEKVRSAMAEIVPKLIKFRGCADIAPAAHISKMIEALLTGRDSEIECCSIVPPKQAQEHYGGEALAVSFGIPVTMKKGGVETRILEILDESRQRITTGVREIAKGVEMLYENIVLKHNGNWKQVA